MERNHDEVIAEMLIQLDEIERRWKKLDVKWEKADKRMDLTIKRMVREEQRMEKAEQRMEDFDRKLDKSIKALDQSVKDQQRQSHLQAKVNASFLKQLMVQEKRLTQIVRKNGLKD